VKVFCVGFNKTGTSSLHHLFVALGFRSFHGVYSDRVATGRFDDRFFSRYDCFSDGERHDFRALDQAFPGSRFILLTRRLEDWLVSRMKHVCIRRSQGKTGWMRKEYERDPDEALRQWIRRRQAYHEDVRCYFADRSTDFREFNLCDARSDEEREKIVAELQDFLGLETRRVALPRVNASTTVPRRRLRTAVLRLAGRIPDRLYDEEELRDRARRALIEAGVPPETWQSDR